MSCLVCKSSNEVELSAEVNIHFRGLVNVDRPGILMFPKVSICLDCGGSRFSTPEPELSQLGRGEAGAPTRKPSVDSTSFRRRFSLGA